MKELTTYKLSKQQREQGLREKEQVRKLEAKRKWLENKPEVVQEYEKIILYLKKDIHPDLADGKLSAIALELLKLERELTDYVGRKREEGRRKKCSEFVRK